jgi:DNA-binding transcriptional ArsR family regulator
MKKQSNFTSDEVRKKILEFLDQRRKKARSINSIQATVTDIKKGLKALDISQSEVVTNLDYLLQNDWVKEEIDRRTFKSAKGFEFLSETRRYRLSDAGIRYIEGESAFDKSNRFTGINITNLGGVTVVGNNNVVRNEYLEVFKLLDQLENEVKLSDKVSDEQKLGAVSDIRTIKEQLSKPIPGKEIIKGAIDGLMFLASIPGLIDLFHKAQLLIGKII